MQTANKELLLKTFSFTEEEFENHNKKSTEHVSSYYNGTMDKTFAHLFTYLDPLDKSIPEYCEFGAYKCHIDNFQEFCDKLDIDIVDNLARIIKEYYHIFENRHEILRNPTSFYVRVSGPTLYHFYNRKKTFMFTCTSPLYTTGSLGYFGCTGDIEYVLKSFEMVYNSGNRDLCYGDRDYA